MPTRIGSASGPGADFDSSKDLLRQWKVRQQSTLIAFKGRAETLRSIGQTETGILRKVFEASR